MRSFECRKCECSNTTLDYNKGTGELDVSCCRCGYTWSEQSSDRKKLEAVRGMAPYANATRDTEGFRRLSERSRGDRQVERISERDRQALHGSVDVSPWEKDPDFQPGWVKE